MVDAKKTRGDSQRISSRLTSSRISDLLFQLDEDDL